MEVARTTKRSLEKKSLGEFVREIVGMDMNAAKQAFAQYLDQVNLDNRQIYLVNQIIEYIVRNGMMKDLSVLQEAPFTDQAVLWRYLPIFRCGRVSSRSSIRSMPMQQHSISLAINILIESSYCIPNKSTHKST